MRRRHAGGEIVVDAEGNVRLELVVDVTVDFGAAEEIGDTVDEGHKVLLSQTMSQA